MTETESDRLRLADRLPPIVAMVALVAVSTVLGQAASRAGIAALDAVGVDVPIALGLGVSLLTVQGLGMLGVSVAYLHYTDSWGLVDVELPSLRNLALVAVGILAALVLAIGRTVLSVVLDLQAESGLVSAVEQAPGLLLVLAVASLLVVAPTEELLYRGVVQTRLAGRYGPLVAIPVASLLFAAMHLPGLSGSLAAQSFTITGHFAIGLVFGMAYHRTENLAVPWLVHGLYNATLFGFVYVGTTMG